MFSIVEYVSNLAIYLIEMLGYWGVFIGMTLESACIPIPSEIIMPFAGYVVWEGKMTLWGITLVGAVGNLVGSLIAYYVGWWGGRPLLEKYGKYIFISHSKLTMADEWFAKYGHEAVLISRVLPVIRTFISLPAGIAHMDIKKFIFYSFIGSIPWCFALGYVGVLLGPQWTKIQDWWHVLDVIVVVGAVAFIIYLIYHYRGKQHIE